MKKTILIYINLIFLFSAISAHSALPKYGKWCGNEDVKLKSKSIDKTDNSCKKNFKCLHKAKSGLDRLKCDMALIKYIENKKYKTTNPKEISARKAIILHFETKSKNW